MKLPGGERAVVDIAKLRDYCLCPDHPRGRHKARIFARVLGLTTDDAELLRDSLLEAARTEDAAPSDHDEYGQRFIVDFTIKGPGGEGTVRSTWIQRTGEDFPRLTSCYVL
jgi:hypothetical protein